MAPKKNVPAKEIPQPSQDPPQDPPQEAPQDPPQEAPQDPVPTTETTVTDPVSDLKEEILAIQEAVSGIAAFVKDLDSRLKKISKLVIKVSKKKRGGGPKPSPDGSKRETNLTRKLKVSDEMGEFLGVDGEASRTDIVKRVSDYSKEKSLKLETDKRVIVLDETLAKLLNMEKGANVRFCDVQKHIKHHFV